MPGPLWRSPPQTLRAKARPWQARSSHVRPVGLLYGATAGAAVADELALPLAGGPIAFAAAEADRRRARQYQDAAVHGAGTCFVGRGRSGFLCSRGSRRAAALRRTPALDRPVLMGIVNVTPDHSPMAACSTPGGGDRTCCRARRPAPASSISAASRPGRAPTPWTRRKSLIASYPVIEGLAGLPAVISVDTRKATAARRRQARRQDPQRRVGAHP